MSKDLLRIQPNERVDIKDFQYLAETQAEEHSREIMSEFMSPGGTQKWILEGFEMTNPSAKEVKVTRGRAILGRRIGTQVVYGALVTEGDASVTIDLNTYSPGTYGIYVKFAYVEGATESRIFWNPAGAGSEYAQSIATRYLANWSVRIESSNPGAEWLKIGEVDQASMVIADHRPFFFEGSKQDAGQEFDSGWSDDGGGGSNDRDSDRAQHGVGSLQEFVGAMRQSIEDIKGRGLRRWWERDIGGMNLGFDADPVEDRLAIGEADHFLDYDPGGGTPVYTWQWGDVGDALSFSDYEMFVKIAGSNRVVFGSSIMEARDSNYDIGSPTYPFDRLYISGSAYLDNNVYVTNDLQVGSEIIPDTALGANIGRSDQQFDEIHGKTIWARSRSGDATHPAMYIHNPDGTVDQSNWAWQVEDDGWLRLYQADDDGTIQTDGVLEFEAGATFKEINFKSTAGPKFTLHHTGQRRFGFSIWNEFMTFIQESDGGGAISNIFKMGYDTGESSFAVTSISAHFQLQETYPSVDDYYDLGRSGNRWNKIWTMDLQVDGTLADVIARDITPATLNTYNLGTSGVYWGNIYTARLTFPLANHGVDSNLLPYTDDTRNLGSGARRWKNIYATEDLVLEDEGTHNPEIRGGHDTADSRWAISFGTTLIFRTMVNPWAVGEPWLSVYRSGSTPSSARFGCDVIPDTTGGWGSIGTDAYPWLEGWIGHLHLDHNDPEVRWKVGAYSDYWAMGSNGNERFALARTASDWGTPNVVFEVDLSGTTDFTKLYNQLYLVDVDTHSTVGWASDGTLPVNAGASQTHFDYFKIYIGGTAYAVPHIPWADIDDV